VSWKNHMTHCGAKWSFEQQKGAFTHSLEETLEYLEIPSKIGHCSAKVFTLPLGSTLSTLDYSFEAGTPAEIQPLIDVRKEFDEPTLTIIFINSGELIIKDKISGKQYVWAAGSTFFELSQKQDYSIDIDTKEDIHAFKLLISETLLKSLLGEDSTYSLFEKLNLNTSESFNFFSVPPNISSLLKDCLVNIKEGNAESIAAQGKVLIYLSALTTFIKDNDNEPKNSRNLGIANRLHNDIISMGGCVGSLSFFSDRYGLSTKTLNEIFKTAYNKTIWSFILDYRLKEIHRLLSESDTAIKTLASDFGYANVSHLTNSFKNKYGYPPGSLRGRGISPTSHSC